jgi:hypothetical protein
MVQVIENRTDLEGVVASRSPDPDRPDYDVLDVDVARATPVEGYADLLSGRAGSRVPVSVRREHLSTEPIVGAGIQMRARLAGPGVVIADGDPATLSVTPAPSPEL